MRFDSLQIPAFGHFTDFALSFPKSASDLHLIYGPNEAGKSSLLRAIHDLFFGIPTRTGDNFLHANPQLLIGAQVSQGEDSLAFLRKKGNKNTLLDLDKNTLPDAALQPFLGPVTEDFFENMFGLDTESLRAGARALLAGEGDLGNAIFSASLGGSPIDDAIKNLEAEAHALWKGTTRTTTIYLALAAYKEAEKAARAEATSTGAWKTLQTQIKAAEEYFAEKNKLHREHRTRGRFVENCLRSLPVLDSLLRLRSELDELEAPEVASDFIERVRTLQASFARSEQALQLHQTQLANAEAEVKEVPDISDVLAKSESFESLHRGISRHLERVDELPQLTSAVAALEAVRQPALEKLPAISNLTSIEEAADHLSDLTTQSKASRLALETLEVELSAQKAELSEPVDVSLLEAQLAEADEIAADEKSRLKLEKKQSELTVKRDDFIARLGIEGEVARLSLPGTKAIQQEAVRQQKQEEAVQKIESDLTTLRDQLSEEETALTQLAKQAEIFTQEDLLKARQVRDEAVEGDLAKLKTLITEADHIVDTLRADAEVLATAAGHQARIAQLQAKQSNLTTDLKSAVSEKKTLESEWAKTCQAIPVPAQSPTALLDWRAEWEELCEMIEELQTLEGEITTLQKSRDAFLGDQDLPFKKLHQSLKSSLKKATQEQGRQLSLQKQLATNEVKQAQLKVELKSLDRDLAEAQKNYDSQIDGLKLPDNAVEAAAQRVKAHEVARDLEAAQSELSSSSEAIKKFQSELESLAKEVGSEASEGVLWKLYQDAKEQDAATQTRRVRLEKLREDLPALELEHQGHSTQLSEFAKQAGVDFPEQLEEAILRIEKHSDLSDRVVQQSETLQGFAETQPLDEFTATLQEQDRDELEEEKIRLDEEEDELQRQRDTAKSTRDEHLAQQRELLKASDAAASQKQAAEDALATVVADTERFTQLHYAIDFLKQQVESYRQKTQGPMIEKTSRFFRTLTNGAFEKVAAQLDEKDQPKLVAIREGGTSVETNGLSEGTADQLYLALRLAAIDLHLENHQAIPLILDDLLMTFDDSRTSALLKVLEEIGKKTQILIFTHHGHLEKLAKKSAPSISLHQL